MIMKARETGELKPGDPVVEITSGNQGCGLAVVCAVLGHPLTLAMSKGNSVQRALHMEALGATCVRVPQVNGKYGNVTNADGRVVEAAGVKLVEEKKAYFVDQIGNQNNCEAHYETTGPEIWRQTGHHVDAFVTVVGTAGTFVGTAKYLKEQNPAIKTYVVEPEGYAALKGDPITKPQHILQGSGYGCIPGLFNYEYMDGSLTVTDAEAEEYVKLIGEKEGLWVGYTSGANVAAAVKLLESGEIHKDAWVVTTLCDSGLKYTPVPKELTV